MKNISYLIFSVILLSCEEILVNNEVENEAQLHSKVISDEEGEKEIIIDKIKSEEEKFSCNFGEIKIDVISRINKLFIQSNCPIVNDFAKDIKGKIIAFIETDVNADGYNELYCISNEGDLLAFSSYKNKSFGEIYVLEKPSDFYQQIEDIASWEVKNNKLHIILSTHNDEHLKTVRYELKSGETGYHLEAN